MEGNYLRTWRKKLNVSQEELAGLADISDSLVSAIEVENRHTSAAARERIAKALGVDVALLWPEEAEDAR